MKLSELQQGLLCTAFFAAVVFGGAYLVEGQDAQYVVTSKQNGKISYRDVNGSGVHVMNFGGDTTNVKRSAYANVHVGDTISGPARVMKHPVAESTYYPEGQLTMRRGTIHAINGVDVRALGHQMNAKQR